MGKKRSHPDVEDILSRAWCYYCERDFEDLKLLISHQKAKHFKCDRCGRRLNTAGGLSVHMSQVHKESLDQVENALPNRNGLDVEIFGMEGIPQEVLEQHRTRIIQNFYQEQEDRRLATGNPVPGAMGEDRGQGQRKKLKVEAKDELLERLAEWRRVKQAGGDLDSLRTAQKQSDVQQAPPQPMPVPQQVPNQQYPTYPTEALPARPSGNHIPDASGLPQRPMQAGGQSLLQADEIDNMIRMAEAGIRPPSTGVPTSAGVGGEEAAAGGEKKKKDKDKKGKMVYDDAEISPEERMAMFPRYAVKV